MKKTESIQEFLARGGKITVVPSQQVEVKDKVNVRSTVSNPVTILTMGEADEYYGEKKKQKAKTDTKPKKVANINLDCLPEEVRKMIGI